MNNPVVYSLVSGPSHLFAVNADTGSVYTRAELDREASMDGGRSASSSAADGAYILGVEAREVGEDRSAATVEVTIVPEVGIKLPICYEV